MAGRKRELAVIKVREILRLKELGLSNRQVADSNRVSPATVHDYWQAAIARGVRLSEFADRTDQELLEALGKRSVAKERLKNEPDYRRLQQELSRKGVTLQLLWEEYHQQYPDGYRYSRFCELYDEWLDAQELSMPQRHKAGEKLFVDYAGQTVPIYDRTTNTVQFEAALFVATLGASSYTYVEATSSQSLASWLASHVRAFAFFGGVTEVVVPDNLKQGVKDPLFYEPEINRAYQQFASHYNLAVIPARVRKPKDKAKVENAVLNVSRRILAPLRDRRFYSLDELNQELVKVRTEWLARPMAKYGKSRKEMFELLDKPALKPLPALPFEFASVKKVLINIDYHAQFENAYYSVPHQFVHAEAFVRATENVIEIYVDNKLIARHARQTCPGMYSTVTEHMPPKHRLSVDWTPERFLSWSAKVGPNTHAAISRILSAKQHPEQGFRAALGIMRLSQKYTAEQMEAACGHATEVGHPSYRRINALLQAGAKNNTSNQRRQQDLTLRHSNVRGGDYYH